MALDNPTARSLVAQLDAELAQRYGGDETIDADAAQFRPPEGFFVLVMVDGEPLGCGGFRPLGPTASLPEGREPPQPRIAELKRMYVRPDARGLGLGRRLLTHLETTAAAAGYTHLWLETGTVQPEAMSLYESAGYTPIPGFGQFADSPRSRSYAKPLAPTPSSRAPLS